MRYLQIKLRKDIKYILHLGGMLDLCMSLQKFLVDDVIKFYPSGNCLNSQVYHDY